MPKCKVCNKKFKVDRKNVYSVTSCAQGLGFLVDPTITKMDAIDCPFCGCQQILSTRLERED